MVFEIKFPRHVVKKSSGIVQYNNSNKTIRSKFDEVKTMN